MAQWTWPNGYCRLAPRALPSDQTSARGRIPMTSTVSRMQKITSELMELNAELEKELVTLAAERSSPLLTEYALLKAFKGVLDHTRHVMWPYLLGAEQKAEENVLHAMQMYRMERIRQ